MENNINLDPKTAESIRSCSVEVTPGTFSVVAFSFDDWNHVISDPAVSPRLSAPFLIFRDRKEVTMVVDETDLESLRPALSRGRVKRNLRLLTFFGVEETSHLLVAVSSILNTYGIKAMPVASFSHSNLLVEQDALAATLKVLGNFVGDLC